MAIESEEYYMANEESRDIKFSKLILVTGWTGCAAKCNNMQPVKVYDPGYTNPHWECRFRRSCERAAKELIKELKG